MTLHCKEATCGRRLALKGHNTGAKAVYYGTDYAKGTKQWSRSTIASFSNIPSPHHVWCEDCSIP
eukprot:2985954-Pleurochrysis_carterae.AAC.1